MYIYNILTVHSPSKSISLFFVILLDPIGPHNHNIIQIHDNVLWIDSIQWNIPEHFLHLDRMWDCMGIFDGVLTVSQNTYMDLNNVMTIKCSKSILYQGVCACV